MKIASTMEQQIKSGNMSLRFPFFSPVQTAGQREREREGTQMFARYDADDAVSQLLMW
jgi:hypothetical protein